MYERAKNYICPNPNRDPIVLNNILNKKMAELKQDLSQLERTGRRFGVEHMLNPTGENRAVVQQLSNEQLTSMVLEEDSLNASDDESDVEVLALLPPGEVLRSLAVVQRFAESEGNPDNVLLRSLKGVTGSS